MTITPCHRIIMGDGTLRVLQYGLTIDKPLVPDTCEISKTR